MAAVDAKDVLEVIAAGDEDAVEAVGADCADPAFGVGVRVRRLDRRPDHLDALAPEHLVEGVAEFGVAVVHKEQEAVLVAELHDEVSGLLCHPPSVGFEVEAMYSIRLVASEMKNST